MRTIRRVFLGGLMAVLPLAVTAYIVYWAGSAAEALFGRVFKWIFPDRHYVPGIGVLFGLALIFAVGILIHLWFVRGLMRLGARLLDRIPFVKTVYGSVRDLMSQFGGSAGQEAHQVVMLRVGSGDARLLGVVTRSQFDDLPAGLGTPDDVAVYLPMSYQVGGFTVVVPRSRVEPVDLSFQEAMRLALTACMSGEKPSPDGQAALPAP